MIKTFLIRHLPRVFDLGWPKPANRLLTIEELRDPVRVALLKARSKYYQHKW